MPIALASWFIVRFYNTLKTPIPVMSSGTKKGKEFAHKGYP